MNNSIFTDSVEEPTTLDVVKPMLVREFSTGATRDVSHDKLDYEGFLSPLVLLRFAEFMHTNRLMKDGSFRSSDNWQLGLPPEESVKSLWRHFMDIWLHRRGLGHKAKEDYQTALCAALFNVQSMLHEELKKSNPICSQGLK